MNRSIIIRFFLALLSAIALLGFVSAGFTNAQTAPPAMSEEEFWQQVDQTAAWLNTNSSTLSAEWQTQADRWKNTREISVSNGQTVRVDTSYLVHLLKMGPSERENLLAYLTSLQHTRRLTTQIGGQPETELLNQILSRPEFQGNSAGANFLQKLLQQLLDWYTRFLDFLFGNTNAPVAIPPQITIAVAALVILVILGFVFRDTLSNIFNEVELAETAGAGGILSARAANKKAQELSGGGDYRQALRYLYLSALLLLDEKGLLRYNRALTNREYLLQVRSRPDLSEHLKVVVDTFDRVWYGYQPIDQADYSLYQEHVTALEETEE